ncbi:MAG TPA: CmcJ/NvfI family oxidoreductase [Coleofasciculaceae cyanobacterium]
MSLNSQILDRPVFEKLPQVEATLNYLMPMAEKPVNYTYEPPPGIPRQSGTYETRKLPIYNARSISKIFSLEREGFVFTEHHSDVQDFYNEDEVRYVYFLEVEQLVADVTGAAKVIVFDHNVRDARRAQQGLNGAKEPVKRVHNDFTAKSGYSRAQIVLSALGADNLNALRQQRFSIINVWRPIVSPVQTSPLAVCDAGSIALSDLVASDLVYRDRVGETYAVTYSPEHRWFYFPQMQQHEVLLIKCFDSVEEGRARFTAHTAFDDPTSLPDAPSRESIELRTLVLYSN